MSFCLAGDIVELVVLTTDEAFLQMLREAVGGGRRIWHVPSADKVSDLLVAGQVSILVVDGQALQDTAARFVSQIKRQFPDLIVVAAGLREDEKSLNSLIGAGVVYRFIHKPMSPGRAKAFADAAVRKYDLQRDRRTTPTPASLPSAGRPLLLTGAALLGAALLVSLALVTRIPLAAHGAATAAAVTPAPVTVNTVSRPSHAERDRLIARTRNALQEDRLDEAAGLIGNAPEAGVDTAQIAFLETELAKSRQRAAAPPMQIRP